MKLSEFLLQLAKEESLPTFILATVNTLQYGNLTPYHKQLLGRIYQVLDNFFGFHLGKILLATSSPDQLSALQDQGSPYLKLSNQAVQRCLSGASCNDILDHNHSGRWNCNRTSFCLQFIIFQIWLLKQAFTPLIWLSAKDFLLSYLSVPIKATWKFSGSTLRALTSLCVIVSNPKSSMENFAMHWNLVLKRWV